MSLFVTFVRSKERIDSVLQSRQIHRIAFVVSHPIQHFAPFFQRVASRDNVAIKVFYSSRMGADSYYDKDFNTTVRWDFDMLGGYAHEFLSGAESVTKTTFWSINNPDVWARLRSFQPHVVVCFGYAQLTALYTLLWGKVAGVPVLMWSDSELLRRRPSFKRMLKRVALPLLFKLYDGFLCIGDKNEDYLKSYGADDHRIFFAPHPIMDQRFYELRDHVAVARREVRARFGIPEDACLLLFVGKLIPQKCPEDIIDAVGRCGEDSRSRIRVLFAGDGELRSELEAKVAKLERGSNPFLFAGFVGQRDLPKYYAAADILIHPALKDAHPLSVVEAVAIGLPTIVSDRVGCVGPKDVARSGENTIVVAQGQALALAGAIETLVLDENLRRTMGCRSRTIYEEYNVDVAIDGVLSAVDALT